MLPTGHVGMFLVALHPSIWPRVTGVRVLAHSGGDISPANISPRKRATALARCPVSAVDEATVAEVLPHPVPWKRRGSPLTVPTAATSTRSRPRRNAEGAARAWPGTTFPRTFEARPHDCMVVGDDGTVTVLDERSATEHRTELEVSVDSGPRIGAHPAALKGP